MRSTLLRILLAIALTTIGWSVGKAQTAVADFEISVDAPGGTTYLTCHRGCDWGGTNTSYFSCGAERCGYNFNGRGFVRR